MKGTNLPYLHIRREWGCFVYFSTVFQGHFIWNYLYGSEKRLVRCKLISDNGIIPRKTHAEEHYKLRSAMSKTTTEGNWN